MQLAERLDLTMDRGAMRTRSCSKNWFRAAAGIAGWAIGLVVVPISGDAQESGATITCTNPTSGASWQIAIDFVKSTVDTNRAKITEATISWFDPTDGGNYTLDRKSGNLTAIVASSTGGYFRHGRCSLTKSR